MAPLLLLLACSDIGVIRDDGDRTMVVTPAGLHLAPQFEPACASGTITLKGNDALVGMRWMSGTDSRLELFQQLYQDPWQPSTTGSELEVIYTLRGSPDTEPPLVDTSDPNVFRTNPKDHGILRLFFEELEPVDIWVDVPDVRTTPAPEVVRCP